MAADGRDSQATNPRRALRRGAMRALRPGQEGLSRPAQFSLSQHDDARRYCSEPHSELELLNTVDSNLRLRPETRYGIPMADRLLLT